MLYKKPNDVTYTEMCIYIDNNMYKEDHDAEKIFEYLYFIALMLAHKNKYFKYHRDYEDFAIYMASHTYFRLTNPKQYQLNDNGEPKMTKIKSVLNYMKSTIYPRKVDFQQQYYAQTKVITEDIDYVSEYSFADKLNDTVDELTAKDFEICLQDIIPTIRAFFRRLPYKKNSAEYTNIYISCLLTFLNSVTLSNADKDKINSYKRNVLNKDKFYINLYKRIGNDSVILFHLDDCMKDYIEVLTRELKRAVALDLSYSLRTYIPTQGIDMLVIPTLNGEVKYED